MDDDDDDKSINFSRRCITKMIQLYKERPSLWDKNCDGYRTPRSKQSAMKELTALVKTFHPKKNRIHVIRKLDSLRACFRKERLKVEMRPGYIPKLWYYDMLSFVNGDGRPNSCIEEKRKTKKNVKEDEEETEEDFKDDSGDSDNTPYDEEVTAESSQRNMLNVTSQPETSQVTYHNSPVVQGMHGYNDEYDAIGINVAAKLRKLPVTSRILAEKMINDVLFQAHMNILSAHSVIYTPDPFKSEGL